MTADGGDTMTAHDLDAVEPSFSSLGAVATLRHLASKNMGENGRPLGSGLAAGTAEATR
ncbi:hypothetical protein EGH21_03045 [Halomicroarcula sp. F13]|uniref:Uncharacterized protein n=1 Tax=Haloarcula rubra TaxID=2487747 RepID=A0AAW4PNN1_9EURY|nr:hypothetical protein [Halomicroarcula rubra]MBX0322002.1 hypothetical protein [Halomicroarcula rubra]